MCPGTRALFLSYKVRLASGLPSPGPVQGVLDASVSEGESLPLRKSRLRGRGQPCSPREALARGPGDAGLLGSPGLRFGGTSVL